jgi:uncharacterized iron-regulated membrane protein
MADSPANPTPPTTTPGAAGSQTAATPPSREFNPQAAILAWLWPGLGHISLGHKYRGLLIMFGVLFLVLTGLLVGGLDAVDRKEDRLWYYAQSLCGPIAMAADYANQNYIKALPEEKLNRATGLGRVNELGTLFVALAGLMNLVVILDALHFHPRPAKPLRAPQPRRRATDPPATNAEADA